MSLSEFLHDIIYEYSDRIVDSALFTNSVIKQVVDNKFTGLEYGNAASKPENSSQIELDVIDNNIVDTIPFFGGRGRVLKPILEQNGRRLEFHKSMSNSASLLYQVKAIRQKMNGSCGYYSLFHSSMVRYR